jgi:HNH endonuclease
VLSVLHNPAKFYERTIPEPNTGCLLWTGVTDTNGYGHVTIAGHRRQSHRVAWQLEHGPIPDGIKVLHRCDTPACVNVAHLSLGTQADNVADMYAKGRARIVIAELNRVKTHCPKGHEYDIVKKSGFRRCSICHNAGLRAMRQRRKVA